MLDLPDRGVGFRDVEFAEADVFVNRDIQLQVIAWSEGNFFLRINRLKNEFLDEGRDILIADNPEGNRPLGATSGSAGFLDVQKKFSAAGLHRIGGQSATHRRTGRGAVREIEAPVMLRALDDFPLYQSVAQVGVPVSADPVGGIEDALGITDHRVGFLAVIEPDDILLAEMPGIADFNPAAGVGRRLGFVEARGIGVTGLGIRKFALHVPRRIFDLAESGGNNLLPCLQQIRIRHRAVRFDCLVQSGQRMVGNQREHVMLHMIVHVPVQVTVHHVHGDRPAIQPVVEHILSQTGMLGQTVNRHQPRTENVGKPDEKKRKNAPGRNREGNDECVNQQAEPRPEKHFGEFALGHKGLLRLRHPAKSMGEEEFEIGRIAFKGKEPHDNGLDIRRPRHSDFRIPSHDNGVAVVPGVTPPPDRGLAHDHKRGDFVERIVHPIRLEGRAVPRFVPAGIRGGTVKHGIDQIRNCRPPGSPQCPCRPRASKNQRKPQDRIA